MRIRDKVEGVRVIPLTPYVSRLLAALPRCSEWVEMPAGVVAQIQGHKPGATAEKHYRRRPLDLLRMWHTRAEAWILEQAGIEQPSAGEEPARLRAVQ